MIRAIPLQKSSPDLLMCGFLIRELLYDYFIDITIKSLKFYPSTRYNTLVSFVKVFSKNIPVISFNIVVFNFSSSYYRFSLTDYKYNSVCIVLLELYIQVITLSFELREMATLGPAPGELLCVDELERKLIDLSEQVELKKEEVRSNFQQLHDLLVVRETFLLREMDEIVMRARQEITEKSALLQELYTAREGLERDLTRNKFKKLLEKNLRAIEDEIGDELARGVNVGWMELDWKIEQLKQSVSEVCKVVTLKERPLTRIDYSAKKCPVWFYDGTVSGGITSPQQLAIDCKAQNIFVIDFGANKIQVFDGEGNHLYQISTPPYPVGIALSDEYIFVSTHDKLVKMEKSNNQSIKSVKTQNRIWGIDTNTNLNVYGCEVSNQSIVVFDEELKFLKRIQLRTIHVTSNTSTNSIKLYDDKMYVVFSDWPSSLPFPLQIFNLEGELVKCLIKENEILRSSFFSIDRLENIIVTDRLENQIKIFSKEGDVLHTITSAMLPENQKLDCPRGVAVDKQNRIIVANKNKKYNLLAF